MQEKKKDVCVVPEMPENKLITIVGAGWSGLATAIELTGAGYQVQIIEAAPHAGGRARKVELDNMILDNGHHIMIGAYQAMLQLLDHMSVDESRLFQRKPFGLHIKTGNNNDIVLSPSSLPAPLHLASSILFARGIRLKDKLSALLKGLQLKHINARLKQDCSVADVFKSLNYPVQLVEMIWAPICLGIMNTDIHQASAKNFFNAIHQAFFISNKNSDFLLPKTDLSSIFPDTATNWLQAHNVKFINNFRIKSVNIEQYRVVSLSSNKHTIESGTVVLAIPPNAAAKILPRELAQSLQLFTYAPIYTIYLRYPHALNLPSPMIGMIGTCAQWIFDRHYDKHQGLLAVVISGHGEHEKLSFEELAEKVTHEVASFFPAWKQPTYSRVLREKRATFVATPGINDLRHTNKTDIEGLWLAGDHTDTDLPATLEGAIRSGVKCALEIITTDETGK